MPQDPRSPTGPDERAGASGLDERASRILEVVVRDYITAGEPIGSHAIAGKPNVDCSSATVRAVLADLEELGLLHKPHTSAGRVPTSAGYRYYVDALLRTEAPAPAQRAQIERSTQEDVAQAEGRLPALSRVLHSLSHHASVVASPRPEAERLQRIEFIPLREGRILAVLVSRGGAVRNRLLTLPAESRAFSAEELERAAQYLNGLLVDLTLPEARARVLAQLERDRRELDATQARALTLGAQAVVDPPRDLHLEGQSSFLEDPALAQDPQKVRALFRALEEKERLLTVLDRALQADELQIFIGAESGIVEPDVAIVAAPYRVEGELVGALGVIGPIRMDYGRVIPLVELTARSIGLAFGREPDEP